MGPKILCRGENKGGLTEAKDVMQNSSSPSLESRVALNVCWLVGNKIGGWCLEERMRTEAKGSDANQLVTVTRFPELP